MDYGIESVLKTAQIVNLNCMSLSCNVLHTLVTLFSCCKIWLMANFWGDRFTFTALLFYYVEISRFGRKKLGD